MPTALSERLDLNVSAGSSLVKRCGARAERPKADRLKAEA